ncbi:MAG: hypothetical protein CMJ35_11355 [Phycisphaerae bacterium]|nr:hypothetical protein [Phycisphaerae bacterium]MBM92189.1 hypothetical protein [Phycisphaerae bacterium]
MTRIAHQPICPKCGYDQSGEIATWQSQCPMHGTCPECGLAFEWADVIDPSRARLGWYVEHAPGWRSMLRRSLPTLWYLLIPNRYWRRMRMESPRSVKRFVLWVALVLMILYIVAAMGNIAARYGYTRYDNAKLVAMKAGQSAQMQATIDGMMADTTTLDYWGPVIGESLLFPLRSDRFYSYGIVEAAGVMAAVCAGFSVMWFLLFCAFPVTRRRSKLRVVHVARAMVVAGLVAWIFVPLAMIAEEIAFVSVFTPLPGWFDRTMPTVMSTALLLGLLIWVQWFWVAAVRVGWKIRARWYELVLVVIASCFGVVFAGVLIAGLDLVRQAVEMWAQRFGI